MTLLVRPAHPDDVAAMAALTSTAYEAVDRALQPRSWPPPSPRSPAQNAAWMRRAEHVIATDPDGCWVAEVDGEVLGCALSRVREKMWILSSFAVSPAHQGLGVGTQLLAAAMHHGRGSLRAMVASSADPRAARRYRRAGFSLQPQMLLRGVVDRAALPHVERIRQGSAGDVDMLDSIDRATRGAAHGPDHELLREQFRLVVSQRSSGEGYSYVADDGSPVLVAATKRDIARDLLWEALASSRPGSQVVVRHITAANEWALDVGLEAGLEIHTAGYLALRSMRPPAPYLHHDSLL